MKIFIKKFLKYIKLYDYIGRLYFLIKNKGVVVGSYEFIILDTINILSNIFFDLVNNINTRGIIEVDKLNITEKQKIFANRYQATSCRQLKKSLNFLINRNEEFDAFIDIGCGKGRPVFYATKYYPKILNFIGVDISGKIINQAKQNLYNFRNKNKVYENIIQFIKIDSLEFIFDSNKKYIIFMFNPFDYVYIDEFFKKNFKLIKKSKSKIIFINELEKSTFLKKNYNLIFNDESLSIRIYE